MTEAKTLARAPRWSRKRFLDEFSERAPTDWGIPPDQVRILERVIKNWLLGSPPMSAVQLRLKGKQYQKALEQLECHQVIRTPDDSVYRPTFHGLAVANAQGVRGVREVTAACQTIFSAAKAMFKRSPTNPSLPYEEFIKDMAMDDRLLIRAFQVLGDSGLGIGVGTGGAAPQVFVSEQVTRYSNIWDYFATMIGWRVNSPPFVAHLDLGTVSHFDEILAVVHCGSDLANKAVKQINSDPAAAITAARSLVEATLKWVLHDANADSPTASPPAKLLKQCLPHIGAVTGQTERETGIGQTLLGMETALHGVAKMRDELSDAHGRRPGSISPSRSHARLAVGLALTISCFLVEAREAHKTLITGISMVTSTISGDETPA